MDVAAGDQGFIFGLTSDETEDCMPLTHLGATRWGKILTDVRMKPAHCAELRLRVCRKVFIYIRHFVLAGLVVSLATVQVTACNAGGAYPILQLILLSILAGFGSSNTYATSALYLAFQITHARLFLVYLVMVGPGLFHPFVVDAESAL